MTPSEVARIIERWDEPAFVALLRAADGEFGDEAFEKALAAVLRADGELTARWTQWSGDQRWTPTAAVDGLTTAWVASSGAAEHVRVHHDEADAVADFIHRMATWLARRQVLSPTSRSDG